MDTTEVGKLLNKIVGETNAQMRGALAETFLEKFSPRRVGVERGSPYPLLLKAWELAIRVQERQASLDPTVTKFRQEMLGGELLWLLAQREWIQRMQEADGQPTAWMTVRVYQNAEGSDLLSSFSGATEPLPLDVQPFGRWEQDFLEYIDLFWTEDFLRTLSSEVAKNRSAGVADPLGAAFAQVRSSFEGDRSDFRFERVPVRRRGVLDRLRWIAEGLRLRFGWAPAGATSWILTGARWLLTVPGPVESWTESGFLFPGMGHERIALRVHPFAPPSYVQQAYREARAEALGGRRGRLPSAASLGLAGFLLDQPEGWTWEQKMEAWNAQHPERPYRERRLFHRDGTRALRAIEQLAGPTWMKRPEGKERSDGEARE